MRQERKGMLSRVPQLPPPHGRHPERSEGPLYCLLLFLFILIVPSSAYAQSASIRLRLIDGRNGKQFSAEYEQAWYAGGYTIIAIRSHDASGVDTITLEKSASIWVAANGYHDCRPKKNIRAKASYSVTEIATNGIVTKNDCGKATVIAKPGELILFVRPLTWWESRKD